MPCETCGPCRRDYEVAPGLNGHDGPVVGRHALEQSRQNGLGQILDAPGRAHVEGEAIKGCDRPVRGRLGNGVFRIGRVAPRWQELGLGCAAGNPDRFFQGPR
jgi:hypothetical protein